MDSERSEYANMYEDMSPFYRVGEVHRRQKERENQIGIRKEGKEEIKRGKGIKKEAKVGRKRREK